MSLQVRVEFRKGEITVAVVPSNLGFYDTADSRKRAVRMALSNWKFAVKRSPDWALAHKQSLDTDDWDNVVLLGETYPRSTFE